MDGEINSYDDMEESIFPVYDMDGKKPSIGRKHAGDLMGYAGQTFRMPLIDTGFRDDRSTELLPPTALVYPSKNVNYHENGLSKRGGNTVDITGQGNPGRGIFHFRLASGSILMFSSNGTVYQTSYSNAIKTGFSADNPVCFVQTSAYAFFCDGQSNPQYWDGSAGSSSDVTAATSWSGNMPFQMVIHTRAGSGAGDRLWAVTPDGLWYSKLNTPTDFLNGDAGYIPIDSIGGLVGAYDLGGQLFAFSRTQTFPIDDTSSTVSDWGYTNAIWEGGVASWRLIAKANNNLFLMAEDGLIYDLRGVLTTGSYNAAPLDRPAFVDKFIRDNVNLQNIANFHVAYDRKLRALKWFMQEGGAGNNIALTQFIDKQPTSAWIIHDNETYDSGYKATCSCEVRNAPGDYQVWTMDFSGNVWKLEQTSRDDNGNSYKVRIKSKPQDLNEPRNNKHFMALAFRGATSGQVDFTLRVWIEGARQADATLTINGTGATFDNAYFDVDTFTGDTIVTSPFSMGYFGRDCQIELINDESGQDFFLAEILFFAKLLGIKVVI